MTKTEQNLNTPPKPYRRALVLSGLATAAIAGLPQVASGRAMAGGMTLDEFIALSSRLTERPASSLDRGMAQRILDALYSQGKLNQLAILAQDTSAQPALAAELRAAWFAGLLPGHGSSPVGYEHALVWSAAAFLHVPGTCGGPTGYWAQPPSPHS